MLHVREQIVNRDKGYQVYDEGFDCNDSTILEDATPGDVYRYALGEHGRCASKMYRDVDGGPPIHCGWVFEKRERYEDTGETYLQEAWVTLYDKLGEGPLVGFDIEHPDTARRIAQRLS